MASLLYGSGLRLLERARLRVKDLDFERGELLVRDGKGQKDRMTMLPRRVRVEVPVRSDAACGLAGGAHPLRTQASEAARRAQFVADKGKLDLDSCRGALEAARDDLAAGMLTDLRQLVTAEAFGDLLETAIHLLEERHHIPAVAVAGAVLESGLRALATSKGVTWSGSSGISKINTALYSANIYDKVVHGEIEAWAKLRNRVDHGDFVSPADVDAGAAQRLVDGVRDFVLKYR